MQYIITKSIEIDASLEKVWENILFFKNSQKWSPWAILENDANFIFPEKDGIVASKYYWNGKILGEGEQTITDIIKFKEIKSDVNFLKPFKSSAKNIFYIEEKNGKILVTWNMISPLPFYLFFIKKMLVSMLERDFERGLFMLKVLSETGKVETSTKLEGEKNYASFYWVGIKNSAYKNELGEKIKSDFYNLNQIIEKKSIQFLGALDFSTSKTCINKGFFEYIVCFKIGKDDFEKMKNDKNIITGYEIGGKYLKVTHNGSYKFLSNSWTLANSAPRNLKLKLDSKRLPFEEYKNSPLNTEEKDLITEIYIPIK